MLKAHSQVWDNFWQLKKVLKWWNMFFISSQTHLSFSRYFKFSPDLIGQVEKRLDKKVKINFKIYDA